MEINIIRNMIMFNFVSAHAYLRVFSFSATFSAIALLSPMTHAAINSGDLVITEMMSNPAAVSDTNGEWFEIFNSSSASVDLNGLMIRDEGSNSHTVAADTPTWIPAGDYFVFGRNADSTSNGGYHADYGYSNFTLSNSSDAIVLEFEGEVIASLIYSGTLYGTAGNSVELLAAGFALTPNSFIYGDGDMGTPGSAGSFTPVSQVPIPAAGWLMASALSGLLLQRKRLQQQVSTL